ncbi:hypothetical protein FKM82_017834 [Ascaphus truei]
MNVKSTISKEVFSSQDERMLGAVLVKRRTKKKIPFLATGGQGQYLTYICISVSNKKPPQVFITKVKQFEDSSGFVRRSQWTLEQLRQVNGVDPNRETPEFDLQFDNASDQWEASSGSEKFTFFQILYHTCQRHLSDRKPEFINCQCCTESQPGPERAWGEARPRRGEDRGDVAQRSAVCRHREQACYET